MKEKSFLRWIERAEYDLKTALAMLKTGRYIYVIFMCQQTIEKIFKAYLSYKNIEVLPIHNLRRLVELGYLIDKFSEEEMKKLDYLSMYYINARYKNDIKKLSKNIDKKICKEFLDFTKKVIKWLKQEMKQ